MLIPEIGALCDIYIIFFAELQYGNNSQYVIIFLIFVKYAILYLMKRELEKLRHARSAKNYPNIKLNEDEHVVVFMKRSFLGLIGLWLGGAICLIASIVVAVMITSDSFFSDSLLGAFGGKRIIWGAFLVIFVLIVVMTLVSTYVYMGNSMYVTNQRAIQNIRTSLFSNSTNVIELERIEDVSFHQNGFFGSIFNIGTLRMSTVGDETTYTFQMLDTPTDEVETISKLVRESHKRQAR